MSAMNHSTAELRELHLVSLIAGICLHVQYFARGEHHMPGVKYLQVAGMLFPGTAAALKWFRGLTLAEAISFTSSSTAYGLLGLYSSLLVHRPFLHPLRRFPGPFVAKLTKPVAHNPSHKSDAHKVSLELYQKYGTFMRVGYLGSNYRQCKRAAINRPNSHVDES